MLDWRAAGRQRAIIENPAAKTGGKPGQGGGRLQLVGDEMRSNRLRLGSQCVFDDGREVGRLHEDPYDPPELRWFWSIIVAGAHQAGHQDQRAGRNARRSQSAIQGQLSQMLVWAGLEVQS
jgi:hypothetical protein